jgi:hypothetical protein
MPTFRITKGAVNYPTPPNYFSLISILILLFHFSIIAKLSSWYLNTSLLFMLLLNPKV